MLATPVETIRRSRDGSDLARVIEIAREIQAIQIIVGLPKHLSGAEGTSARDARRFTRALASRLKRRATRDEKRASGSGYSPEIVFFDERLTTVEAHRALGDAGRRSHQRREIVDQVAATILLEAALMRIRSGRTVGEALTS